MSSKSVSIAGAKGGGRGGGRSGSRGGRGGRGRGDSAPKDESLEPYVEKEIWSQRHKLWRKFATALARLPAEGESMAGSHRWVNMKEHMPLLVSSFIGNHNDGVVRALRSFKDMFESDKTLPDLLLISGPSGSGKSSMLRIYINELCSVGKISYADIQKWIFFSDALDYKNDFGALFTKLSKFNDSSIDKSIPLQFRLVVIDNADVIPASQQQQFLKKIMEISFLKSRYFLVKNENSKLIGYIMSKATLLTTKQPLPKVALTIVLNILHKNRIGYDRFGVKEIFDFWQKSDDGLSVSKIVDMCQSVFLSKQFLSVENVLKFNNPGVSIDALRPLEVTSIEVLKPIPRCKICTLVPPCKHTSFEKLSRIGERTLRKLPRVKDGLICPTFMRYGYCAIYNKYNHCSLDHPKNLHVIVDPPKRCPICTILWPCLHCKYTTFREQFIRDIKDITERLKRLRLLLEPDCVMTTVDYMNYNYGLDHWRPHLHSIQALYVIPDNLKLLTESENWLREAYCTDIEEFTVRDRVLRRCFAELYKTPMLKDLTYDISQFVKMMQDRENNREMADEEEEGGGAVGVGGGGAESRPSTAESSKSVASNRSGGGGSRP